VANTLIASLPYPALGDSPNGPAQIQALATAADSQVVPRYATTAARDAAITAPVAGQVCWTTTPATHWYYSGAAWVIAGGSTWARCRLRRAANQSIPNNVSTTFTWDTEDQDSGGYITVSSTTITIPTGLDGSYDITVNALGTTGGTRNFLEIGLTSAVTGNPTAFRQAMGAAENRGLISVTGLPLAAADSMTVNLLHQAGAAANWTAWLTLIRRSAA
jgi:hypothetical protein